MKRFSRFTDSLLTTFHPPFNGLWLAALFYFAWCFFVVPHSGIVRGDLPDTDDYMYLNQVLDWLSGQGWYDNVQYRLNPPVGAPIHFSRLAQMPMATLIRLLELCGLGPKGAGMLMAVFYPLLLLGGFFAAVRWLAASFVPREWAGASAYVALFATGAMFMFQPGHIDHHGLDLIIMTLTLGCAMRMIEEPGEMRWGLTGGLLMALGLTVALEVLPWLLLVSGWIGLWAIFKGGSATRNGLVYALALYLGSCAGLLITRLPAELMTVDVLAYSVVYVILTASIAVVFAGIVIAARYPAIVRFAVGASLAAFLGVVFLDHFPDLAAGPYGGMDPALAQLILGEIIEAQPLKIPELSWFAVSRGILGATVALIAGLWFLRRARGDDKWRWGLILLMLAAAIGLTVFYQRRFVATMGMASIIPMTALLQRGWVKLAHWKGRGRVYGEIGLLLLVGPLPAVLYPAVFDGRPFSEGVLLFPSHGGGRSEACNMFRLENILRDPVYFGGRQHLIMNTLGIGPELLFRTGHSVLSAPYHMDVDGNVDATRFFSTPYADEAEAIARRRHIELVVACRTIPEVYLRPSPSKLLMKGDSIRDFSPHFIMLLMQGKAPPWLKQANIPGLDNYVIYEVLPQGATSNSK